MIVTTPEEKLRQLADQLEAEKQIREKRGIEEAAKERGEFKPRPPVRNFALHKEGDALARRMVEQGLRDLYAGKIRPADDGYGRE